MASTVVYECKDISERIELYAPLGLYMKQIARLTISVQMPLLRLPGQAISSWELTERIRELIAPEEFIWLRSMIKTGIDIMRFEGEVESRSIMRAILPKLDNSCVRLEGYQEPLRVRAAEAKLIYPTRHEWETFFRDAKNMNELKPGERPDTVHIEGLPVKWFAPKNDMDNPSEEVIRKVFSQFGEIREIDIPMLDPMRKLTDPSAAVLGPNALFDVFIQFTEYISFVKVMDALRGMKLLKMDSRGSNAYTACIKVDFDRTKHLSDNSIKKRRIECMKAEELGKLRLAEQQRQQEEDIRRKEIERLKSELAEAGIAVGSHEDNLRIQEERRKEREEKRRLKRLDKKRLQEERQLAYKIALEERKILVAQRKLESMRLLEELFNRVKILVAQEELQKKERELKEEKIRRMEAERRRQVEKVKLKEENSSKRKEDIERQLSELRKEFYQTNKEETLNTMLKKKSREVRLR